MRFVHTADWHLGRLFHGTHLTDDQAWVLDRLVDLLRDERPDALLVAGDVYDRAVPPVEAVRLLDDFLGRVADGLRIPVVLIAGNHDGAERLAFGARLLAGRGVHVFGHPTVPPGRVRLADQHGDVHVHALPFPDPPRVRQETGDESVHSHDTAVRASLAAVDRDPGARHVLLAHAFVAGGEESESERPLSVGGASVVSVDAFRGFDYVALGHLHRPQRVGSDSVRYSGSLLKYSFSEAAHEKAVLLVELGADGAVRVQPRALGHQRDVRTVEGCLDEVLAAGREDPCRADYIQVRLLDRTPTFNALGKLREVHPNVLEVRHLALEALPSPTPGSDRPDHARTSDLDLFRAFLREVDGVPPDEEEEAVLVEILERLDREAREATS